MATNINKQTAPGFWSTTGLAVTMTAADVGAGNETAAVNDMLLVVHNTGASQRTYTITSAADQYGRTGNVAAQTIDAGVIRVHRLTMHGWADSNAKYNFSANHAEVKFGLVTL